MKPTKYGFYFYYEMEAKDVPDELTPEEVGVAMADDMGLILEDVCDIFPFPDCDDVQVKEADEKRDTLYAMPTTCHTCGRPYDPEAERMARYNNALEQWDEEADEVDDLFSPWVSP